MTATDLVFYDCIDEATAGTIDLASPISTGTLQNLLPNVSALVAESGGVVYAKYFVKNTHGVDTALATNVCLAKPSTSDDRIDIFAGTVNDTTATFVTSKMYGIATASNELDRPSKTVNVTLEAGAVLADMFSPGDTIHFLSEIDGTKVAKATIATGGVGASSLTINEDMPAGITTINRFIGNTVVVGDLAPGASQGIWVRQTVPPFAAAYTNANFLANHLFVSS